MEGTAKSPPRQLGHQKQNLGPQGAAGFLNQTVLGESANSLAEVGLRKSKVSLGCLPLDSPLQGDH